MSLQLQIPYASLLDLVEQLSPDETSDLLSHLEAKRNQTPLSKEAKIALYHASILNHPIAESPSIRRQDWYDNDGR